VLVAYLSSESSLTVSDRQSRSRAVAKLGPSGFRCSPRFVHSGRCQRTKTFVRWRWRKVRMIEQICKRAFKAHPHPFREMESLGQPSRDRSGARSLQDSHAAISHRPSRNCTECSHIEHTCGCGIRVAIADTIRALEAAAIGKIEIARIEARACSRREIRPGFPKADGADGPSAKR
jgi:hypothetical protein